MAQRKYTPRRAAKRWLEEAPDYILDCFDHPKYGDRYTVFFGGSLLYHTLPDGSSKDGSDQLGNTYVQYLGMSGAPTHPQGISLWNEMSAHDAASYRYASARRRVRWLDLPENIRQHVIARATAD